MGKKADMSIQTIVIAVLALTVLLILIFIFKNQTGKANTGFNYASNDAIGGIQGTKCQTMFSDTKCCDNVYTKTIPHKTNETGEIPWSDCVNRQNKECCEKPS